MTTYWKHSLAVAICLLLLIFGIGVFSRSAHAAKKADPESQAIAVQVTDVQQGDMPNLVSALGTLSTDQVVTVSSDTDGRITHIYFKNGQQVAKGMPIVQLNNQQAAANYQSAVTALKVSTMNYQRSKLVINVGALSQQALAQLKANMDSDAAQVKRTLAALNQKQIVAPFTGTLGKFSVHTGDYVSAGDAIVTLVNSQELLVNYALPENLLPQLKQGQLVKITVDAYPHRLFYGTVSFIAPTINKDTRTVSVQASVPNAKHLLSPGMFVHISQQLSVDQHVLIVPEGAVLADVKGYYVYKVQGNKAVQTYIKLGARLQHNAGVLQGLKSGDKVVIAGQQKLEDGSLIRLISS